MEIKELLSQARDIWGNQKLPLSEIIIRMGKVFGDICRWARNAPKDSATHNDDELKKELGNIIFSTIRWCDELGYDPEECIEIAKKVQRTSIASLTNHPPSKATRKKRSPLKRNRE
ncbi:MAG: hypothetical protein HW387_1791 [Parachlamydiales bacterium]|nr:hypothetical protein [Parachlamydiales bacterium]